MVFGAFLSSEDGEDLLRGLGVRDSKKLSAKKRSALREVLPDLAEDFRIVPVAPSELDANSLNEIGKDVIVRLAVALQPDVLILDAPVPPAGIPAYRRQILQRLEAAGFDTSALELIAENGADDTYPCCAAASILAKTHRDALLAQLQEEQGRPIGSGYPSDPKTVAFLEHLWRRDGAWPPFVRTKWQTARRIVAESTQGRLF
jgi:ribonuclease HII